MGVMKQVDIEIQSSNALSYLNHELERLFHAVNTIEKEVKRMSTILSGIPSTEDIPSVGELFPAELLQVNAKIAQHWEAKGLSYQECSIDYLDEKIQEEYEEFQESGDSVKELPDLLLICLMRLWRANNDD